MRKITITKKVFLAVMFLMNIISYSQNFKPFTPRYDQDVRGDVLLIGNNILNRDTNGKDPNDPYSGDDISGVEYNSDFDMEYIDTDGDNTTFSSSSAYLASPRPAGPSQNCYKIVYVGLYWGAIIRSDETGINLNDINKIKFKLPTGGYNNITGQVVYNASATTDFNGSTNRPYACYADVTSLFTSLANPVGNYTVADVLSSQGRNGGTGLSAGWSLFIVYEDPTLTSKSIVSFDGFSNVNASNNLNVPVSGFRTIPAGQVAAKFAFTCLEGDAAITGDYLRINGATLSTPERPANNFFNSTITNPAGYYTTRTPNSSNTLGFDAGIISNFNPLNSVITNNATSATLSLGSTQDAYFYYFTSFSVDIIAPEIKLTKTVTDVLGNSIEGQPVTLGQPLDYTIGFQNVGNDPARSFTIRDVLPNNVIFNYPADLDMSNAPPGTTHTYVGGVLTFTIPNDLPAGGVDHTQYSIGIHVQVVTTCLELADACSNVIRNQAFATYTGTDNTAIFSDEGSIATLDSCGFGTPNSTNFLVGLENCSFVRSEVLCGNKITLTAANGYASYTWTGPGPITSVSPNNQIVEVSVPGTYVVSTTINGCIPITETINVITFGASVTNPVIPVADQVVTCPDDGKKLPLIFLCGVGDSQAITTNIADAISFSWERYNGCPSTVTNPNCAKEAASPSPCWTPQGTLPNFTVSTAGEYRVVINFQGGCQRIFYFNVFQNLLAPTAISRDIICGTPGQITVNNVPPGYEYNLTLAGNAPAPGNWVPGNVFSIGTAGVYTVHIQQIGVVGGCVFTVPNIPIQSRTLAVTTSITQPQCFGQKGSITLTANNVNPQYSFTISQGGTPVNSVGPIAANNYTFSNLNPGNYSYLVTTQEGCSVPDTFTINNPALLTVTAAITKPITCTDGEITIYPVGGTPPYSYFINSTTVFQGTPIYAVSAPGGTYNIQVVDANNCSANTVVNILPTLPPVFNITRTNITCSSSGNNGTATVNVTNTNGNTLMYNIDGGPFTTSNVFTNLAAGNHTILVQYSFGGSVCTSTPQVVNITAPAPITATATITQEYSCVQPGIIQVTNVSGGTAPYTYSIDGVNFVTTNTFTITSAGTYTITIKDANGCTITRGPFVIDPLVGPSDMYLKDHVDATCPSLTGMLNVDVVPGFGGQPPRRFRIVLPYVTPYVSSGLFAGLSPGVYTFEVIDRFGCTYQETFSLDPIQPTVITPQVLNNVRCFGTSTGNGQFTISNIANDVDYTYTVRNPSNVVILTASGTTPVSGSTTFVVNLPNLTAGTYTISVYNDSNKCTDTSSITIAQPPSALASTIATNPVTCVANGQATITATGGWGGYTYTISPVVAGVTQSGSTFSNIPAGSYTITTTDSGGCSIPTPFTLNPPTAPTASINTLTSDFCYDGTNGASIVVNAAGGVAPYTFSINGGPFQPSNTAPNSYTFGPLTPGVYNNIIVRDAFGCQVNLGSQTINPQLTLTTTLTKDLDCTASPNAVISGNITGGTPIYTCMLNTGGGFVIPVTVTGNTFTYSAATAGTYQFEVTDSKGCKARSSAITINPLVLPTATTAVTNVTCNGLSNGSVTITPSLGTPPYSISFASSPFTATTTYSGLAAGTYSYQVRDSKSCIFNGTVTVSQPTPITGSASLTTPYTCTTSGVITVGTPSGGTPGYTYSINGVTFQAGNTFTITSPGSYIVTIKDNNGCTLALAPIVVTPLTPPTNLGFVATALTCPANTSNVTLTTTGGSGTLTYQTIAPSTQIIAPQTSNVFPNLAPGSYTFQVTDARNCTYQESFTINPLPPLTVVGTLVANVRCFGTSTGAIRFTVSGFSPNYSYVITGPPNSSASGQTAPVLNVTNLPAGTYNITVTNPTTNCTATASVTVTQPAAALAAPVTTNPVTCIGNGQATVNATGGWGGYTYTISPTVPGVTQSGSTFSNIPAGSYTITTTDSGGCQILTPFTLTAPTPPTASVNIPASDFCYGGTNGTASIVVTAAGGTAPYTFSVNGGPFNPSNNLPSSYTFGPLSPGTYNIIVRDSFGCQVALPAQTINPQLTLTTGLTKDLDCTVSPNAVISGNITGGYPGYTHAVIINGTLPAVNLGPVVGNTFTYSAATSGNYQFQVTDSRGCIVQATTITINPLTLPQIVSVTQTQQIKCFGDSNAAINVVLNPGVGTGPFIINVLNNTTGVNYGTQTSGLTAGSYTITVTDSKSCQDTEVIVIGQPDPIFFDEAIVPITCTGTGTTFGSISVTGLAGGTAPFTYILTSNSSPTQTFIPVAAEDHAFTVLTYGIYQLTVVDANGCSFVIPNIIMSSPPTDLNIDITTPTSNCATGGTLVVTVAVFPPGGPYHFALYQSPYPTYPNPAYQDADVPGGLTSTFTGLVPGVLYSIIVYDEATNCYYFKEASGPIPPLSTLTSNINVVNNVTCMGSADANVSFTYDTTDATSVTYQIFNSQTNTAVGPAVTSISAAGAPTTISNVGPLAPGVYYIRFIENDGTYAGCRNASVTFTVTESTVILTINAFVIKNDNCNTDAGQISATAQGGTAPYLYIIQDAALARPLASDLNWTSSNILNAEAGNYIAYVMDAFGCIQQTPVIVLVSDSEPTVAANVFDPCAAEGDFAMTVSLTPPVFGIGPHTYSIDGNAFQTMVAPFTVSGLSSGTHTVTVRDFNGCGNTASLTILAPVTVSAAFTTQPTCLINNGTITVNATGGSGNYSYTLLNSSSVIIAGPQASNVFASQAAGDYIIRVTDTTTSCNTEIPFSLIAPTPVTFTTVTQPVLCIGDSNGTITVILGAGNDNPPYNYAINAGTPQASNIFTGLAAGTYAITVTSGRGCTFTDANVIVGSPTAVVASGIATSFDCAANNTTNTATLTVSGLGGTPAYTYSIDGTNYFTTSNFTIVDDGTTSITVYVKDANGCIDSENVTINPIVPLASTFTTNQVINCTQSQIVTINASGGTGSYTYQVVPLGTANVSQGIAPNDNQFTITAPGTYTFQVTDANTHCYLQTAPYVINPFNTIDVVATPNTPVNCFGDSNGSINVAVSGYTGAYTYTVLDNGGTPVVGFVNIPGNTATPLTISGLAAGSYTVQVTETALPLCIKVSNTVTVGTPSSAVSLTLNSNINANCNSGAIVTVSGSGGTPGYTYAFMPDGVAPVAGNYSASNTATLALPQLLWDVHVLDANGCHAVIDVTIAVDPMPTVSVPVFADDQCTSSGTSYTFTATGTGIAPLTYSIGSGFQSSGTFIVSASGTYTVTIKDGNGCTATNNIVIYSPVVFTPTVTTLVSCANNDGVINITASGGSGNYSYTLLTSASVIITGPQASNIFGGLSAGNYIIRVTDTTTNCVEELPVTLDPPTPVTFNTTVSNVSCFNGNDGSITVNLLAGNDNPPYMYQITAPAPYNTPLQASNVFGGLPAGTYTVSVSSGRGCTLVDTNVVITQPTAVAAVASLPNIVYECTDNAVNATTLTITVTPGTGTPGYTYSIDGTNYFPTNTFSIVGTASIQPITFHVRDANGCSFTGNFNIPPYVPLQATYSATPISCIANSVLTITATGGTNSYSYQVLPVGAANVTQGVFPNDNQFTISGPGQYIFQVTDANTGCYVMTIPYDIPPYDVIAVTATAVTPVTCFNGNNGQISINVSNYTGPYTYNLLDGAGNAILPLNRPGNTSTNPFILPVGLTGGNYSVQVFESNAPNCDSTSNVVTVVSPAEALTLDAQETANVTCDNNLGVITAIAQGGWGSYQYELVAPVPANSVAYSSNNTFTGLPAGTYTVNVRDLNGCIVPDSVVLTIPAPIFTNVTPIVSNVNCFGDLTGSISIPYPTGGQGSNYSYTITNGNPVLTQSGPINIPLGGVVISGLGAGTYNVIITDGYNCRFTSSAIVITQPTIVNASLAVTTTPTCTLNTVLTLTASGGTAPYTYSADNVTYSAATFNPSTTISLAPNVTGTYHYFIKDANGCVSVVSNDVQVDPLTPLNITIVNRTNILCGGDASGSISVFATGGLLNYVYTLLDGAGNPVPGATQTTPGYFTNLVVGNYQIRVDSGNCVFTTAIISITEPPVLTVTPAPQPAKCNGGNDGFINLIITGGTGAIQYAISPNLNQFSTIVNPYAATGFDIPNLTAGNYTIIIQDQNGCFEQFDNLIVTEPSAIAYASASSTGVTCTELVDGTITINGINGGTGPYMITSQYTTQLDNSFSPPRVIDVSTYVTINNAAPSGPFSHVFTDLAGNTAPTQNYLVGIKDANGCKHLIPVHVEPGVLYTPVADLDIHCRTVAGISQQYVEVTAFNTDNLPSGAFPANGGFLFSLDVNSVANAQTSPTFNSDDNPSLLVPGTHIIYVFTNTGCDDQTPPFTILASDIDPLVLNLEQGGLNEIVANTNNALGQPSGTPPYTFTFNGYNNGNDNTFIYEYTGLYEVTVTDSKGCVATKSLPFEFIPIFIPNVFTPNGNGGNDVWGPTNTSNYKNLVTKIYDRYGRMIAELPEGSFWDGKYQGKELPSGDYWYVVKVDGNNDKEYVGHFTLYR